MDLDIVGTSFLHSYIFIFQLFASNFASERVVSFDEWCHQKEHERSSGATDTKLFETSDMRFASLGCM
jgi:hypothetical protein